MRRVPREINRLILRRARTLGLLARQAALLAMLERLERGELGADLEAVRQAINSFGED